MGCISSKFAVVECGDNEATVILSSGESPRHIVSLTSSTYGVLKLDEDAPLEMEEERKPSPSMVPLRRSISKDEPLEVINAWELMGDLEDDDNVRCSTPAKKKMKTKMPTLGRSSTPRRTKKSLGKENSPKDRASPMGSKGSPNPLSPIENTGTTSMRVLRYKNNPSPGSAATRRRSLTPMFDPELVAAFERELLEEEQIKKIISSTTSDDAAVLLGSYPALCPHGGEDAVVLYTTTLRGIRKTFEDCNEARAAVEACGVRFVERDVSMDSGYREELRALMGNKEVRVPQVFVKGRLIGDAAEVSKLHEAGKLQLLLAGIPRSVTRPCEGCGGARFVLCRECSGSCKIRRDGHNMVLKCQDCNENGLIHCPICS